MTFLETIRGTPRAPHTLTEMMRDWCEQAGIEARDEHGRRLTPHGLRKAMARRLAEAGCTASEIAAVTGHQSLAEVERYTRAYDRGGAAERAMEKLGKAGDQDAKILRLKR